jgi:hypothetical protein
MNIYYQVKPNSDPPDVSRLKPFRAVLVLDVEVSSTWQTRVSDWLVGSGCLYMMAWGVNCSSWDDSVDIANLEQWDYKDIPDDENVVTTWHENEPRSEAFEFAKYSAFHPTIEIDNTLLIHISNENKEEEMLDEYVST